MKKSIAFLLSFVAIFALFLGSILYTANDRSFYPEQYVLNNTEQHTGMSVEDLTKASDVLLDYMFDKRDDTLVTALVNGVEREVYDERETMHMVDVKDLFLLAIRVLYILGAISIVGATAYLIVLKSKGIYSLARMYNLAAIIFVAISVLLGIFIVGNFNVFWTLFHQLVFTNDLWLLDPNVSIMINMFPSDFFFAMCVNILINFASWVVILLLILNVSSVIIKKKRKEKS